LIFFAIAAALLATGLAYEMLGAYVDRRRFPPRGRIVQAGSLRLHINEEGSGAPAVILESGIAASSLSWTLAQPEIAKFTRVVSYDRAGLGWSAACAAPRTLDAMLDEFDAMLEAAAVPPPYILVGHSFGGLLIRAWAFRHPDRTAGLILVDPVSLEYWGSCSQREQRRLATGVSLARRGKLLARFGIVRAALTALAAGGKRFPKLIGRATARRAMSTMETLVGEIRKLPPETWPIIRSHWSRSKCLNALAAYLACLPQAAAQAKAMPIPCGVPFIVLSAASATGAELAERNSWVNASGCGRHEVIPNTGHWIPLERPDAIVSAVEDLIRAYRCLNSKS
jgi:pimeloyl-ACP methyl ester carboxylesterase